MKPQISPSQNASSPSGLCAAVNWVADAIGEARAQARLRESLSSLSDHLLADAGLRRADIAALTVHPVAKAIRAWRERAHARAVLSSLSDRLLDDIGLDRAEIAAVSAGNDPRPARFASFRQTVGAASLIAMPASMPKEDNDDKALAA